MGSTVMNPSDANEARRKQQRTRNWALLAVLVALVVLFYAITIAKMSG